VRLFDEIQDKRMDRPPVSILRIIRLDPVLLNPLITNRKPAGTISIGLAGQGAASFMVVLRMFRSWDELGVRRYVGVFLSSRCEDGKS
jgi:hypothetical protein